MKFIHNTGCLLLWCEIKNLKNFIFLFVLKLQQLNVTFTALGSLLYVCNDTDHTLERTMVISFFEYFEFYFIEVIQKLLTLSTKFYDYSKSALIPSMRFSIMRESQHGPTLTKTFF